MDSISQDMFASGYGHSGEDVMRVRALFAAASMLAAASAAPAHAVDLTYYGSRTQGTLSATYTLVTDGKMGELQPADFLSFSADITDGISSVSFDQDSGFIAGGYVGTDGNTLSSTDVALFTIVGPVMGSYASHIGFEPGYTEIYLSTTDGLERTQGADLTPIATEVSAAPEPSTWLLMFAGISCIGLMLRRAKKTMGFRFKDAFSA